MVRSDPSKIGRLLHWLHSNPEWNQSDEFSIRLTETEREAPISLARANGRASLR